MLSLLGSLLGFGTSFLPKVMGYFEEKRDQAHELQMMDKQVEANERAAQQKLQMISTQGDIDALKAALSEHKSTVSKASQWVINLSATVRPIVTYCLFFEFFVLTVCLNFGWLSTEEYKLIWNNEIQAVWAAVVSFWFGSRSFNRKGHS